MQIDATNVGHRPVTITGLHVELPGKKKIVPRVPDKFVFPDTRLPAELKDGAKASLYFPYEDIAAALRRAGHDGRVKITPVAVDSTGKWHRGKPWRASADEMMAASQV